MSNTFMIIDDDINIVQMLKHIISSNSLGKVVLSLNTGEFATEEILFYNPDILLIDYLMPNRDGVEIIDEIIKKGFTGKIVMISQVEDNPMISRAYNAGILFFIKKPINSIEVINILKNISVNIELEKSMALIKNALGNISSPVETSENKTPVDSNLDKVELILSDIGILSDLGSQELIKLIQIIAHTKLSHSDSSYKLQFCYEEIAKNNLLENSNNISSSAIEQRIRRIIQKALSNIAELGKDDYYNDRYILYSTLLFDFKEVRQEMNYIGGKSKHRGKINVKKFVEGIISKL